MNLGRIPVIPALVVAPLADDAPFQAGNDRLLLDDDRDELVAAGGVQVDASIHARYMT